MKLTAYVIDGHTLDIRPAPIERAWMDNTAQRYAYRCLPLSIANAVITVGSKDAYYQSSRVVRKSTSDLLLKLGARPLSQSGIQILDLFYKQQ